MSAPLPLGIAQINQINNDVPKLVSDDHASSASDLTALDRDSVARVRAGHKRSFDDLVRRHQQPLFYICLRYVKNQADAADLCQRAFVKAYAGLDRFRGQASFRTWLYRIAINLSLNHLRDHKRERATEIREDTLTLNATGPLRIIDDQRSQELRAAIARLPNKQRMVLELRIYDELPFREVAVLAECSENAAKVNFHHAVKALRKLLAAAVGDDDGGKGSR